jgi:hypothetical protein
MSPSFASFVNIAVGSHLLANQLQPEADPPSAEISFHAI